MNEKEGLLSLSPIRQYNPPEYPTNIDANSNPALLKKLPSRWQKNAAAAACVGLMGSVVLTGCPWIHFGGSGPAPIYVAHLTEQEALNFVRAQLEEAGLDFSTTPPESNYIVYLIGLGAIRLELFDEDKNVAITIVAERNDDEYCQGSSYIKEEIEKAFFEMDPELTVGVFYCPGKYFWDGTPNDSQKEELKESLKRHLSDQVSEFIELLQTQDKLE